MIDKALASNILSKGEVIKVHLSSQSIRHGSGIEYASLVLNQGVTRDSGLFWGEYEVMKHHVEEKSPVINTFI